MFQGYLHRHTVATGRVVGAAGAMGAGQVPRMAGVSRQPQQVAPVEQIFAHLKFNKRFL
jgi:hypothetical protein